MRQGADRAHADNGPVVVVGVGMALISSLVALSGLTIPLPDVVYRAAASLGGVLEAASPFDDGHELRSTPLRGGVLLTATEQAALRAERLRSGTGGRAVPKTARKATPRAPQRAARSVPTRAAVAARPSRRAGATTAHAASPHVSRDAEAPAGTAAVARDRDRAVKHERAAKKKPTRRVRPSKGTAPSSRGALPVAASTPTVSPAPAPVPAPTPVPTPPPAPPPVEPTVPAEPPVPAAAEPEGADCSPPNGSGRGKAKGHCK